MLCRRYCGEGGIDVPSLEVLRMRALGKDESQTYPGACMLDDVYEDIVEIIMTRHLVNYKVNDAAGLCRKPPCS